MNIYKTAEVAKQTGIHPNTVRLYEELGLIPKPERQANGYRVFTGFHVEQIRLARIAFKIEVLQNGLRKQVVEIVKTSARGDLDQALRLTNDYLLGIRKEQENAHEAIEIVKELLCDAHTLAPIAMKRKEVADFLHISMDTLRNWELNGLLTVKRRQNGYRVYTAEDIQRLKIIRSLRCANYSLEAILRMLNALSCDVGANIERALDTPDDETDIISACDKLITSLRDAERNAGQMLQQIEILRQF